MFLMTIHTCILGSNLKGSSRIGYLYIVITTHLKGVPARDSIALDRESVKFGRRLQVTLIARLQY